MLGPPLASRTCSFITSAFPNGLRIPSAELLDTYHFRFVSDMTVARYRIEGQPDYVLRCFISYQDYRLGIDRNRVFRGS